MSAGFVKLMRGSLTEELMNDPAAFSLLSQIALRARFTSEPSLEGLTFGQAMIGDHEALGLSRGEYRSACRRLARWKLVSFRGVRSAKAGRRGTIATLLDSRVFSLTDERKSEKHDHHESHHDNHHSSEVNDGETTITRTNMTTTEQPPNDHRATTNQKDRRSESQNDLTDCAPLALGSAQQKTDEELRLHYERTKTLSLFGDPIPEGSSEEPRGKIANFLLDVFMELPSGTYTTQAEGKRGVMTLFARMDELNRQATAEKAPTPQVLVTAGDLDDDIPF